MITASLGLFLIVLTLMAIQVRNGRDPAIGPGPVIPKGKNAAKPGSKTPAAASVVSQTSPVPP